MNTIIIIGVLLVAALGITLALSLCRISGHHSRLEEQQEALERNETNVPIPNEPSGLQDGCRGDAT